MHPSPLDHRQEPIKLHYFTIQLIIIFFFTITMIKDCNGLHLMILSLWIALSVQFSFINYHLWSIALSRCNVPLITYDPSWCYFTSSFWLFSFCLFLQCLYHGQDFNKIQSAWEQGLLFGFSQMAWLPGAPLAAIFGKSSAWVIPVSWLQNFNCYQIFLYSMCLFQCQTHIHF